MLLCIIQILHRVTVRNTVIKVFLAFFLLFYRRGIHQVSLKNEAKKIESYGEKIKIYDGEINIVDKGEGEKTIFLLPGPGIASPYLDFKPMINGLKKDYRVVTIEPFGYGLSSQTNRRRSIENIVDEIHQVAQKLKIYVDGTFDYRIVCRKLCTIIPR